MSYTDNNNINHEVAHDEIIKRLENLDYNKIYKDLTHRDLKIIIKENKDITSIKEIDIVLNKISKIQKENQQNEPVLLQAIHVDIYFTTLKGELKKNNENIFYNNNNDNNFDIKTDDSTLSDHIPDNSSNNNHNTDIKSNDNKKSSNNNNTNDTMNKDDETSDHNINNNNNINIDRDGDPDYYEGDSDSGSHSYYSSGEGTTTQYPIE